MDNALRQLSSCGRPSEEKYSKPTGGLRKDAIFIIGLMEFGYDFTADQFEMPGYSHKIEYKDILSSSEEAATEAQPSQIYEMRAAFGKALKDANHPIHTNKSRGLSEVGATQRIDSVT